jgi:uncharacterized protein YodC (DUF2158 family)
MISVVQPATYRRASGEMTRAATGSARNALKPAWNLALESVTMNCDFKVGDVVRLKAGGPDMIIESIGPPSHGFTSGAWCIWQVGDQKKRDFFEFMTLCHADTKPMKNQHRSASNA